MIRAKVGWLEELTGVVAVLLLLSAVLLLSPPSLSGQDGADVDANIIPGRYIVLLKGPGSPRAVTARLGLRPRVVYERGLWGFAGEFSDQAIRRLRADPAVLSIEPDRIVTADDAQPLPAGIDRVDADLSAVAMIDGVDSTLDVDVAIIDSGIQPDHPDLRVVGGARFIGEDCAGGSWADDHGHGTHVAGTAAAVDNSVGVVGVAPGARLWAVKVLDETGHASTSCMIAAMDWITANAATIDVVNISLRQDPSTAMCQAISTSVAAGVVYAVSAGNSATDASSQSPANCDDVLTVSAIADYDGMPGGLNPQTYSGGSCSMTGDDIFACFSNRGPLVEIAAPGVSVYSTYPTYLGGGSGYTTMSGTSMSTPHVTGAAALDIIEHGKPTDAAGAAAVRERIVASGAAQDGPLGFTGDPDSNHEPLLLVRSPGTYDAAVGQVTTPDVIQSEDLVPIEVTVWHDSTSEHVLAVTLTASGGSVSGSPQTAAVGPDSLAIVPFTWDTTGLPPGDYSLTATISGPPGDMNTSNNSRSITATVRFPHDAAVTALSVPSTVVEGDQASVQVTVANAGAFSETFSVSLTASGGAVSGSPQTLTLEPAASATLSFTWDTTGLAPAGYTLTATASLDGDANPDNDTLSKVVTVRAHEHDVSISYLMTSLEIAEDTPVAVEVIARNFGTFSESISVSVEASGGTVAGSPQQRTLAPDGLVVLSFIWHTPGARPEPYTYTAEVEPVPGEVDFSNNSLTWNRNVVVPALLVVNSVADPGSGVCDATECTLREAITSANAVYGPARIEFNVPPGGPQTIAPQSALPNITSPVIIDGTTQPGFAGTPIIELDGSAAGSVDGLAVVNSTSGSYIDGLVINRFGGDGIDLSNGQFDGFNVVQGNYIGVDASGLLDLGNAGAGIRISSGTSNVIGGTSSSERNVISGNDGDGVRIYVSVSSSGNVVQGNYIGTDRYGATELGNGGYGVLIDGDARYTAIGGAATGAGNVISGNYDMGLVISSPARGSIVQGNLIGTNASGTAALTNDVGGVYISGYESVIGGVTPGAGNVISANGLGGSEWGFGLYAGLSWNTVIQGNRIGTDITGTVDLGNRNKGIQLVSASDTIIGGTAPGAGNIVSGNGAEGIELYYDSNTGTIIQGNLIGTDATGSVALGNDSFGVRCGGTTTIGGTAPGAANVISANGWDGIIAGRSGCVIQGNYIGTDKTGTIDLGNLRDGIEVSAPGALIGGTGVGAGNTIAHNGDAGVRVSGSTSTGNSIRGNSIHSNDDLGIDNQSGGNGELPPPVITAVSPISGTACAGCTVDVYSDYVDEGRIYEGSTEADGNGDWSFLAGADGPHVTATATDVGGNTSEFSAPVTCGSGCTGVTPTPSPTPTPTPVAGGAAVGGIAELPDVAENGSASFGWVVAAALAAAVLMALTAAAWYTRKRPSG